MFSVFSPCYNHFSLYMCLLVVLWMSGHCNSSICTCMALWVDCRHVVVLLEAGCTVIFPEWVISSFPKCVTRWVDCVCACFHRSKVSVWFGLIIEGVLIIPCFNDPCRCNTYNTEYSNYIVTVHWFPIIWLVGSFVTKQLTLFFFVLSTYTYVCLFAQIRGNAHNDPLQSRA